MLPDVSPKVKDILKNSINILLVDWPDISLALALLNAGFTVYSYSPNQYSSAQIDDTVDKKVVFSKMEYSPSQVDIVNVFRPEAEHKAII